MSAPDTTTETPAATDGARPANPATVVNYTPPPAETDDDGDTTDWKAETEKWKTLARKNEDRAKANAAAKTELDRLTAASQSDLERAVNQAKQEASKEAQTRYSSKVAGLAVRAAAAGSFQDPADAVAHLKDRLGEFVDDDGDVDEKAIEREVASLLKARPYLGKAKPPPDFDGGQRNGTTGKIDMNGLIRGVANNSRR